MGPRREQLSMSAGRYIWDTFSKFSRYPVRSACFEQARVVAEERISSLRQPEEGGFLVLKSALSAEIG